MIEPVRKSTSQWTRRDNLIYAPNQTDRELLKDLIFLGDRYIIHPQIKLRRIHVLLLAHFVARGDDGRVVDAARVRVLTL